MNAFQMAAGKIIPLRFDLNHMTSGSAKVVLMRYEWHSYALPVL